MTQKNVDREAALVKAVRKGNQETVSSLLRAGVSPNVRAPGGMPVLSLAVSIDRLTVIFRLLNAGADPNASDATGRTAMAHLQNPIVGRVLIEHGFNADPASPDWPVLLDQAAREGETDLLKSVLDRGVPVPKKMLLNNYWADLGAKGEQSRRVINAHRMAQRLGAAMSESQETEAPQGATNSGLSPL